MLIPTNQPGLLDHWVAGWTIKPNLIKRHFFDVHGWTKVKSKFDVFVWADILHCFPNSILFTKWLYWHWSVNLPHAPRILLQV